MIPSVLRMDAALLLIMLALVTFGVVMVFSSSALSAYRTFGSVQFFFRRQLIWSLLGLGVCVLAARVPMRWVRTLTPWVYLAIVCCLALVLVPSIGREAGGARRWIDLGPVGFQPSEFAKLGLIAIAALYLSNTRSERYTQLQRIAVITIFTLMASVLIALEPDIGTAFQVFLLGMVMLFLGGLPYRYLVVLLLVSVPVAGATVFTSGYRRARVMSYLNPWADPRDVGYHSIQFQRSLQSGGIFGKGLGQSQYKLGALPEPYTDSIIAVIGEELGFVGIIVLLGLMLALVTRGYVVALRAPDPFQQLFGAGLASLIGMQAALNFSVVGGLIPTTGVAMPFVSYGGSSLLVNMIAVGFLLNISREIPT